MTKKPDYVIHYEEGIERHFGSGPSSRSVYLKMLVENEQALDAALRDGSITTESEWDYRAERRRLLRELDASTERVLLLRKLVADWQAKQTPTRRARPVGEKS